MAEIERAAPQLPKLVCDWCLRKRECHTFGSPGLRRRALCPPCLWALVHQALK
jgi:hypothetical protein